MLISNPSLVPHGTPLVMRHGCDTVWDAHRSRWHSLDIQMTITVLMDKLMEIERALQRGEYLTARTLVLEAEDCTLEIGREMIRMQAENLQESTTENASRPHIGLNLARIISFRRH